MLGPGVVGLARPLLFLRSRFLSLGWPTVLPFLLCASIAAGVEAPFGVAATEGATLSGGMADLAAATCGGCAAWVACSEALFLASTALFVFEKTNAPGSPSSGLSFMYSSPYMLVRLSDCMSRASEVSAVEAMGSAAGAVAVVCEASGSVGASVGLPMRLAVAAAFGASNVGGK
jgi:hypothetical protein